MGVADNTGKMMGPEVGLAYKLSKNSEATSEKPIYLIKCAFSSSGFSQGNLNWRNYPDEEKTEVIRKAASENLMEIIRVALVEHAEETLSILGLICFIEDKEQLRTDRSILNESVSALLDVNVLDFFISLMQSVAKISKVM